jgi:hypothetical protein
MDRGRVFMIYGPILDAYGKSAGINGANGILGYGYPRGDEFLYDRRRAQRFSLGLMIMDGEGQVSFIPQPAPSTGAVPPAEVGAFPGGGWAVREDFQAAWNIWIDSNDGFLLPDGPVRQIALTQEPWIIDADPKAPKIGRIYFQTFERGTVLFILAESPDMSFRVRILRAPFLDTLLWAPDRLLPGFETADGKSSGLAGGLSVPRSELEDDYTRALVRGLSAYGLPLTDAMPKNDEDTLVEAQRFSRGWILGH